MPSTPPSRGPPAQALGGVAAHAAREFELTAEIAELDAKNYQLWNYRRRLALALGAAAHAERVGAVARGCLPWSAAALRRRGSMHLAAGLPQACVGALHAPPPS